MRGIEPDLIIFNILPLSNLIMIIIDWCGRKIQAFQWRMKRSAFYFVQKKKGRTKGIGKPFACPIGRG